MATINYNGMELQSIAECKVFEEPREMLVWNTSYNGPIEKMVCAIIPYRHEGSVITTSGAFEYCAEIPKKSAPRRATNRELAKWLAQGMGEVTEGIEDSRGAGPYCSSKLYYSASKSNEVVENHIRVRNWDDTEWHVPTVDYIGIEDA